MIKHYIKKIASHSAWLYGFLSGLRRRSLVPFYDVGFHGDTYLINFIFSKLKQVDQYIETGMSVGSTFCFVAQKFSNIKMFGCEPDRNAFNFASLNLANYSNVLIRRQISPNFLYDIVRKDERVIGRDTVFWLDAHANGFKWPLRDEIKFITSNFVRGYIFIDDFLVPGNDLFGYDEYEGQVCSYEYIKPFLNGQKKYRVIYPKYNEKTSAFCDLRGWVMIDFGHDKMIDDIPAYCIDMNYQRNNRY